MNANKNTANLSVTKLNMNGVSEDRNAGYIYGWEKSEIVLKRKNG